MCDKNYNNKFLQIRIDPRDFSEWGSSINGYGHCSTAPTTSCPYTAWATFTNDFAKKVQINHNEIQNLDLSQDIVALLTSNPGVIFEYIEVVHSLPNVTYQFKFLDKTLFSRWANEGQIIKDRGWKPLTWNELSGWVSIQREFKAILEKEVNRLPAQLQLLIDNPGVVFVSNKTASWVPHYWRYDSKSDAIFWSEQRLIIARENCQNVSVARCKNWMGWTDSDLSMTRCKKSSQEICDELNKRLEGKNNPHRFKAIYDSTYNKFGLQSTNGNSRFFCDDAPTIEQFIFNCTDSLTSTNEKIKTVESHSRLLLEEIRKLQKQLDTNSKEVVELYHLIDCVNEDLITRKTQLTFIAELQKIQKE